jgi:H+/Cl- antiporter ClcA
MPSCTPFFSCLVGFQYVLAYLNGTNTASWFSPRILFAKIISLCFAIAAGLTLGLEGPFVYIGAGIALFISQMLRFFRANNKYSKLLTTASEERIFIAGGAAAGLAVAFNAPIAGTLLAMEPSTSFLTTTITLRIFVCSMFAAFFGSLTQQGFSSQISSNRLVTNTGAISWSALEIFAFVFMGLVGGLLGIAATRLNVKVIKLRMELTRKRKCVRG